MAVPDSHLRGTLWVSNGTKSWLAGVVGWCSAPGSPSPMQDSEKQHGHLAPWSGLGPLSTLPALLAMTPPARVPLPHTASLSIRPVLIPPSSPPPPSSTVRVQCAGLRACHTGQHRRVHRCINGPEQRWTSPTPLPQPLRVVGVTALGPLPEAVAHCSGQTRSLQHLSTSSSCADQQHKN